MNPESHTKSWQTIARRTTLFITLLMSGGLLLFPRLPLLMVMLLLCLAIVGGLRRLRAEFLPILGLLTVILLLTLLRPTGFSLESILIRYANFIAALALLGVYLRSPPGALVDDFFVILPWMAVQAILTPVVAIIAAPLFTTVDINGTNYETLLFIFTYHVFVYDSSSLFPRPDGFFFEPGVFQIYLNIYLFLALLIRRRPRHVVLAVLAVVATQSTTGLLVMMLILGYAGIRELRVASLRRKLLAIGAVLFVSGPLISVTLENVENKTVGDYRGSAWAREYDFFTGLAVIRENPVFGIGFDYADYYREAQEHGYLNTELNDHTTFERGNSNGLITMFYSLGIPLGSVFLIGLFRQRFFVHRVLFGLCMALCLFGEALSFTPFFLLLMFSGLIPAKHAALSTMAKAQVTTKTALR